MTREHLAFWLNHWTYLLSFFLCLNNATLFCCWAQWPFWAHLSVQTCIANWHYNICTISLFCRLRLQHTVTTRAQSSTVAKQMFLHRRCSILFLYINKLSALIHEAKNKIWEGDDVLNEPINCGARRGGNLWSNCFCCFRLIHFFKSRLIL